MSMKGETSDSTRLDELFRDGTTNLDPQIWLKDLRNKIYCMFRNPLKEEFNDEVFKWISALCMCKPRFTWLCECGEKWSKDEAKMFSLITRLSINEIHILLPRIRRHLIYGDDVDLEDGKVMDRPAKPEEYSNLGVHLIIFEETIHALVHGQDDDESGITVGRLTDLIENEELKSLLERLKEITGDMLDYLEDVDVRWNELFEKPDEIKIQAAQGVLRSVSVWVSEEPGSFQEQCKRFLIRLIVRALHASQEFKDSNHDILMTALHSICSSEQEMKEVLGRMHDVRTVLQKYLDHVQQCRNQESDTNMTARDKKRKDKQYKLQCGLVKDLLL